MMEIDGNYLEGGGQILRTSVALSCLTGKPVRIFNIRAGRPTPGLKAQHLAAISAVAELCNAKLEGGKIGSEEISFHPGKIDKEKLTINISTAGSVGLVLQAIFPACVNLTKPLKIEIEGGGTFGKWAPSVVYLQKVFLPILERFGFKADVKILKHGFYPKGGARVVAEIFPSKLKGFSIEKGVDKIKGISIVSEKLRNAKVAERQVEGAEKILEKLNLPVEIKTEYVNSTSVGTGIELWTDKTILGAGTLGEIGKKAEKVGSECAEILAKEINSGATVDKHLADQLIPFMGLADGNSGCKVSELTNHTKTNIWVTEKFLDRRFEVKNVSGLYEIRA
ncbi:MAG: RNA 3'-terminal phosphate cyclase [Candidatus Aenigmarchaeota archaeon]|nr:RNA 3'-terminal phosphate cyclase [Candidatus Aenigmarchaeota archaeon]